MPTKLEELTLIYRRERIRWDETAILECDPVAEPGTVLPIGGDNGQAGFFAADPGVVVKASCQPDELIQGLSYRFYGRWDNHPNHGRQFIAKTFVRVQPHGRGGVIRYLMVTCAGHGVGRATAEKLWDKFQGDAVRILREQPDVAAVAVGKPHFTDAKAAAASEVLREESALEAVHIDLIDLLGGRGFPRDTAKKAVQEWGNRAAVLIRTNPYLLMRFRGCGFLRTDQLYLDQGGNPTALKRQALCAWYAVARDNDGHTWFRPEQVEAGLRQRISGTEVRPVASIVLARRAKILAVRRDEQGRPWVAEWRKAENEKTVAEHVQAMLGAPCQWPEVGNLDASEHQRENADRALQASLGILSGSPGTGKTYTAARLIGRLMTLCGSDLIAVAAHYGKAAVRITEALESYGIRKQATTIHRLLGVASRTAGEGWGFEHDENNPLPFKWIFIDEGSTIDTDLAAALFRACAAGTHLLLIGDVNQLPPIGHGAMLRDLIGAGVPTGELREIRRNSGTIVRVCAAIRDGLPWSFDRELDPENGVNLMLKTTRSNGESREEIVKTLRKLPKLGFDPVWDVQVLVSVNKRSELSRVEMNKRLQGELNPGGEKIPGCPFRKGDKIIRIRRNSLMPVVEDCGSDENRDAINGKIQVCNGEVGRVVEVERKRIFARFPAPKRLIVIPFGKADESEGSSDDDEDSTRTGCDFDLGYACTVHKFQGSEEKIFLYGLDDSPGAMRLGCRELFYTGISRGKFFGICYGKEHTAKAMCLTRAIAKRKTFLRELVQQ